MADALSGTEADYSILVLGIGNLLWADEGFGVRALEQMQEQYSFPPRVRLLDGGTQGLYLIHHVQAAQRLIVFDAVDYGLPPGTMKIVLDEEVPAFLGVKKISLHQTGFQEVLACAKLTGRYPEELVLIGVQPAQLEDFGGSLRAPVKAQLGPAIAVALGYLGKWGLPGERRVIPRFARAGVNGNGLDLAAYEAQRPGEREACRTGDPRFLSLPTAGED